MKTPTLALRSARAAATTYSFLSADGFHSWALCTVNDTTGELLISSDWGSWSYRWNASRRNLGDTDLTAFLGDRSGVDYLARKLQNEGSAARRFSSVLTAKALAATVTARRLEDAREQREYTEDGDDPPLLSYRDTQSYGRRERIPYLTRETARRIVDDLTELGDELDSCTAGAEHVFWERLQHIDGYWDYGSTEPYEHVRTEQTYEDKILRETILPALIAACADTTRQRRLALWMTNAPQPPDLDEAS